MTAEQRVRDAHPQAWVSLTRSKARVYPNKEAQWDEWIGEGAGYTEAYADAASKLPEPTPPAETQAIKVTRRSLSDPDEVAALLDEIHKDVQGKIHDEWDWMNASFYTECLRCMVHYAREAAVAPSPAGESQPRRPATVDDLVDLRTYNEVLQAHSSGDILCALQMSWTYLNRAVLMMKEATND